MTDVVRACKRVWGRAGVARRIATEMAADLEVDLAAAAEEGISEDEYVGRDRRAFALAWASARGVLQPRPRLLSTALAALVGALPGTGFALFVAYGLSSSAMADLFRSPGDVLDMPTWVVLGLYALGAVFAYAGAVAGVAALLHWRLDPAVAATVRAMAVQLPWATAAAVGATVLFASIRDFSTDARTVLAEVVVAAAVFAAAVVTVRLRAISRERS